MATDGTNPLVAQRQDTTSTLSGAGVFDDIQQLSEAIDNKSWVSGALAGVALGVDTIAYVSDPLGTRVGLRPYPALQGLAAPARR